MEFSQIAMRFVDKDVWDSSESNPQILDKWKVTDENGIVQRWGVTKCTIYKPVFSDCKPCGRACKRAVLQPPLQED